MRSHEARPISVPPNLNFGGDSQHGCSPVKTLEGTGDSPSLSPMIYATDCLYRPSLEQQLQDRRNRFRQFNRRFW